MLFIVIYLSDEFVGF